MNNCGYCKHYLPGKALCGLTKKEVGFLEVKPCYEAQTQTTQTAMEENNETKTKVCKRCGRELPLHEFGRHARTADGLQVYCRDCCKEAMKKTRRGKVQKDIERATYGLASFTDEELFNELRRRGFSGYLKQVVEISV